MLAKSSRYSQSNPAASPGNKGDSRLASITFKDTAFISQKFPRLSILAYNLWKDKHYTSHNKIHLSPNSYNCQIFFQVLTLRLSFTLYICFCRISNKHDYYKRRLISDRTHFKYIFFCLRRWRRAVSLKVMLASRESPLLPGEAAGLDWEYLEDLANMEPH